MNATRGAAERNRAARQPSTRSLAVWARTIGIALVVLVALGSATLDSLAQGAARRKKKLGADGGAVPSASVSASAGRGKPAWALPDSGADAADAEAGPAASASASASAVPVASVSAVPPPPPPSVTVPMPPTAGVPVKLEDKVVFVVRMGHGGQSAEDRAKAASKALEVGFDSATPETVRVERGADVRIVFAGETPIIQLYPEDALAAGDSSVDVHAASVATSVREAIRSEKNRSVIARRILSFAIAIVLGLFAAWVVRKIGDLARRAREWIADNPERIPAIRLKSMEVIRPATLRSGVLVSISVGKWLAQFTIAYVWLVFALSLFASTRAYTERLTGFMLAPFSALMGRVATALPVVLVAALATLAVAMLVRFVGLFFASVERGETTLGWLPAELAPPTSLLLRIGVVLVALVFSAPIVTGDSEGALARTGTVVLVVVGLSGTPLLASVIVGITVIYLRRVRSGDFAEIGGRSGRVLEVGLLDVRLEDNDGGEVRVPHLLSLIRPTRVFGRTRRVAVRLVIGGSDLAVARETLLRAASPLGESPRVELLSLDADGAEFEVSVASDGADARSELQLALGEALRRSGLPLRRRPASSA